MIGADEGCTLGELVTQLGGVLSPETTASRRVFRFAAIDSAGLGEVCFLASPRYLRQLGACRAEAIILREEDAHRAPPDLTRIVVSDPYLWYARAASLLHPPEKPSPGIHPHASVSSEASVAHDVTIDAGAVIEAGVQIGRGTRIGAGCVVGRHSTIGESTLLYPRVTIYADCEVGSRVIIHAGAVIGADGFGFARAGSEWVKIPQTGRVRIGDDCEIGANTTIDRGALDDTVIEAGCKLDNQIQVAHNVRIGEGCAIAACVGIAGSAVIGPHCQIGGGAGILGHLEIAGGTIISAMSLVTRSISKAGFYTGIFPLMPNRDWEHAAAGLRRQERLRGRGRSPGIAANATSDPVLSVDTATESKTLPKTNPGNVPEPDPETD